MADALGRSRRRERLLVVGVVLVAITARSSVFVFGRAPFDADQAIVGLMAKHLADLRALPVYFYGQHYMLAVEAWLAAPLFYLFGASVTLLKLPLLAINLAIGLLLLWLLGRHLALRPAVALFPTLFFVLARPGPSQLMLETNGGNVEPLLYVLLLWVLRERPIAFGIVAVVGFLNREFTVYGLTALVLLDASTGALFTRHALRRTLLTLTAMTGTFQAIEWLKQHGSAAGPGTSVDIVTAPDNFQELATRACWDPAGIPGRLAEMFTVHLGQFFTQTDQWLWVVVGGMLLAATARCGVLCLRERRIPWKSGLQFPTYLVLVGLQAAIVHASVRCGGLDIPRYFLLVQLAPVGIVALLLHLEPKRWIRRSVIGVVVLWGVFGLYAHAVTIGEFRDTPPTPRDVLLRYLEEQDIRYARADYWTAYYLTFMSNEAVIVASNTFRRVHQYGAIVDAHPEAVTITTDACPGGTQVAQTYYVCLPQTN